MNHYKNFISKLLKATLKKEINPSLDEQTINIEGTGSSVFIVKKGSLSEGNYSGIILGEIELNAEIFYVTTGYD